jgi:peptidyl-Lys metalloendopeptidase
MCLFALSIFMWQCPLFSENIASDNEQGAALRFKLEARDSYILGQPVPITFTLENLMRRDVYVLTWYTPFEGLKGKIFKVTRNGAEIPYEGRMIKRGEPTREDYLHIAPLGSASATVDLALVYNMGAPGTYRVEFIKGIYDLTFDENTIPRELAEHKGIEISGNAVTFSLIKH